jgi:hypothetical protein
MTRGMPEKMTKAQMIGAAFLLVVMGILGGISFGDEIPQKSQPRMTPDGIVTRWGTEFAVTESNQGKRAKCPFCPWGCPGASRRGKLR